MKALFKSNRDKMTIKTKKLRQTSKKEGVFSYSMKKGANSIILTQEETRATLDLNIEQVGNTLRITQFTLTPNTQLSYLCPEVYDAALLEIIVHAVMVLFGCAVELDREEIIFFLDQEDSDHLFVFESLFEEDEFLSPREDGKVLLTLYNTPENKEFLKERANYISTQLKQGLWQMQRGNPYIKNFLQNHQKGALLPGIVLQNEKINRCGTVSPFSRQK